MRNILRWLIRFIINLVARVEVTGYENLPTKGNFVIATNHLGIIDAPMAYYALDRWDLFIPVAEKWEDIPIFRWLGKYFNFIFIDRFNPDIKALRKIIKLMDEGNNLIIAPEGTRSRVGSMIAGQAGCQLPGDAPEPTHRPGGPDRNGRQGLVRQPETLAAHAHCGESRGAFHPAAPAARKPRPGFAGIYR